MPEERDPTFKEVLWQGINDTEAFIEKASYPPYLDVFSRKKRDDWVSLGDIHND